MQRSDIYIISLSIITIYIFKDFVDIVSNGPIYAILNSQHTFIFIAILSLLCSMTFIIFNIFTKVLHHVQNILVAKDEKDSANHVSEVLPQVIALSALYMVLLISQSLWYIVSATTF